MTSVRYEIQIKRDQEAYVTSANVVSELARFARGRIEDSSFNRFALNGIQSDFFEGIFSWGIFVRDR